MSAPTRIDEDLGRRLREVGRDDLLDLLQRTEHLDAASARATLRNPHVDSECIERLTSFRDLHSVYEFRRDLVLHRLTPPITASRFLPTLFWRDLARVSTSVRLRPALRRAAETLIQQRLPQLTLGETITLARIASPALLPEVGRTPQPRVVAALLENPRLTEGTLLKLLNKAGNPEVLAQIAANGRWGARYSVRLALVRHPRTPLARALSLVASLRRVEQRALAMDRSVREPIRKRAELLSAGR